MEQKRQELLQHLHSAKTLANELQDELLNDLPFRQDVTALSKAILQREQAPFERVWEVFTYPTVVASLRTALDAGWLDQVTKASLAGVTAETLAKNTGADSAMVARIMRLLSTAGIVDEVDTRTYARNDLTVLLTTTALRNGTVVFSDLLPSLARMHLYFDNARYQTPPNVADCPFAFTEGMTYWKRLAIEPRRQAAFDAFMDSRRIGRTQWYEIYPIEDFKVAVNEDILLVDVGGGIGHDLVSFNERRKSVDLPGRLVLQDLPNVIAQVPEDWALQFTKVSHSFFDPQPDQYRHARAYYMRMILHDWADAACLTILGRLRDAMKPGYTTLLLNGIILPDVGCPYWAAATDLTMMSSFGGKERTLQEWHELIDQVPELKIEKILPIDEGARLEHIIQIGRYRE